MKVYTMTFHWATNYGAVLQSYALQHYLQTQGVETEIINYIPRNFTKTFFGCLLGNPKKYKTNFRELKKERAIRPFRQKHLRTTKLYSTHEELTAAVWDNGLYICGSDQIWNPYFTMQGEGKITLSYYLDFAPKGSKKVSYAASFGTTKLEMPMSKIVAEQLVSFDAISVRERSAVAMLERVGISAQLICDPVFLLSKSEWEKLFASPSKEKNDRVFKYILHQPREENDRIYEYIVSVLGEIETKGKILSVEGWMRALSNAEIVVTNSFHAVVFSVIFHRPFIAIVQTGNGMNDRLMTLLDALGLTDRVVDRFDEKQLASLISAQIDWEIVDKNCEEIRLLGADFLQRALG